MLILAEGIVFILLTVTVLRKKIFDSLPDAVRVAIPSGIGLFIALLGLQNAGIVVADSSTCVDLASFNLLSQSWGQIMPMLVTLCTFLAIVIMSHKNIRGSVLIGIIGGMIMYYLPGLTVDGFYAQMQISVISPFEAFKEFKTYSLFKVFKEGFDFSAYSAAHGNANLVLTILTTALAFCMVDMFDTLGTSTVTTFSEVNAGVAAGGRTGLTSVFCGAFFFIAMFLSPIAQLIPSCATAAALIYVGLLMMGSIRNVNRDDFTISVPVFLTLAVMPFTYNISSGIAFGLISYIIISCFCGKAKEIKPSS